MLWKMLQKRLVVFLSLLLNLSRVYSPQLFFLTFDALISPPSSQTVFILVHDVTVFLVHCKWKYIRHSNSYLLQRYILLRAFYVVFYFFLLSLTTKATK